MSSAEAVAAERGARLRLVRPTRALWQKPKSAWALELADHPTATPSGEHEPRREVGFGAGVSDDLRSNDHVRERV